MHRYDDNEDAAGSSRSDVWPVSERTPLLQSVGERKKEMGEKIGISQQTLVSDAGTSTKGKRLPQYIAAVSATLGAVAFGTVMGWSTAAGEGGVNLAAEYDIPISLSEFSWIGSILNLGAAAICVPIGILADLIGRKLSMLILVVPFMIGWGLVIWANSVAMFYVGRFLLGIAGGAFCVTAPIYTGEIAEPEIRGSLGSYFQLMLTIGILFAYVFGSFISIKLLSIISAVIPLIFFVIFFFMPETPVYYLMKGKESEARKSLLRLRGEAYDIERELNEQKEVLLEQSRNKTSFFKALTMRAARNGLITGFGLMLFQQLSGVNAIIFYTGSIFSAGGSISTEASTIVVGVIQVVAVFISSLIVDKLGRKVLLIASEVVMMLGAFVLGIYYYLDYISTDLSAFSWVPLVSVCLFILLFNFGFGPIPWTMMGELFSPQIKGVAGSSACLFNWLMAFVVTRFYNDLVEAFGNYTTFWCFSVICAIGIVFVVFIVPETKGKSLEQIQIDLGAEAAALPPPAVQSLDKF